MLHFLPPYSPDLNPIKMTFSKMKRRIKDLELSMVTADIDTIMLAAFASISQEDCQGWIFQLYLQCCINIHHVILLD